MGRIAGLTREELERDTDEVLEKCGGDRSAAAKIIGIAVSALDARISRHPPLRAKWGRGIFGRGITEKKAPSEAVQLHRPLIAPPLDHLPKINASPAEIEKAMDLEDAQVRQGITKLGLSERELNMAVAFQSFQRRMFTTSFEMLGGGITKSFVTICVEVEEINQKLKEMEINEKGDQVRLSPQMEAILREDRSRLLAIQVQMYDRATKAVLTQIEVKRMRDGKGEAKKDKPGFKPLMNVTGDVHIHEQK